MLPFSKFALVAAIVSFAMMTPAAEIESRTATVEFRGEGEWNGGAITSFTCADGRNFAAKKASELFAVDGVRLGDPKNVKRSVNSSMTRECKIASAADSITLTYTGFKEVLEKAVCTVRADATDGMLHWRITVEPKPGWAITEVIYPRMALSKQLGASGEDDVIAHGGRQWGAVHNPGKTWNPKTWDGSRLSQPGDLFAQFGCYYDAAGGFYTQAQDESALEAKAYWIYARDTAIMSEWHWREWVVGPRELPYDIVTGSFKGPEGEPTEWMDAADIYKRWALKQRWCRTPFRDRKDLPEWLRSAPAMVRFYREWLSTPKHVDAWFTGHWRKNFGEVPLVGAVWGWEKHGIWITPDYFPAYPSDEAFGEVVAAMRRNNAHLFPWPSGYHWTLTHTKLPDGTFKYASTNEFKAVEHLAVRDEDGSVMIKNPSWYEGGAYADLCRGDARTRAWWTRNVSDKLVKRGAELIQFDQVNGGRHPPCWSKDHGHVPCAGRWWAESMRQQLDEIQASAAKLGTNLVLGFEDANEFYLDRVGIQDYRDVEISTSNRSVVSVWNYLYHEFVPTFQSNVKQDAWSCAHYAVDGQIPFILPYFANLSDAPAIPNCKFDQVEAGEAVGWNQKHALRKGGTIELALGRGPQGLNAMRFTAKRGARAYLCRSNYVNGEPAFVAGAKYRMSCLAKVNSPKARAYVGDSVFTMDWKYLGGVSVPLDGCTSGWQRVSKVYTLPKNCEIHHYAVSVSEGEVEVTDLLLEREVAGGGWKPVILSGDTDYLKFMRQWVKLYHGEGRDFLAYGRRIRPPRVKCGTVVRYFGGSSKSFHRQVEAVCSAAYETLDGKRRALALANGSKTEQTASWTWKGKSVSVTLKPGELRLVPY